MSEFRVSAVAEAMADRSGSGRGGMELSAQGGMGNLFRFYGAVVGFALTVGLQGAEAISPSAVAWQRCYGGTSTDFLVDIRAVGSNGFVVVGSTSSGVGGNKTSGNFGQDDAWVVRLDGAGNVLWNRTYGGTAMDYLYAIEPTSDGGFIAGGKSRSGVSGNKTSPHYGTSSDYNWWVLRLGAQGDILWDRTFPGKNDRDEVRSIAPAPDGGFMIAGSGESDGTNSGCPGFGSMDWWLKKLDGQGNIVWERCYGGESADLLGQMLPLKDGFLLGGTSYSAPSGNKTSVYYGSDDVWLVKVNFDGNILWQQSYGSTGFDSFARVQPVTGGGFIFLANSTSVPGGNKTSGHYGGDFGYDLWVVRVDAGGNILWDRTYGGLENEFLGGLQETMDGGFVLGASSESGVTGNKTSVSWGSRDYWIVRLDRSGQKVWEQSFGGTGQDACYTLQASGDGGFVLAGFSDSGTDGNKTAPKMEPFVMDPDFWLVKLQPDVACLKAMGTSPSAGLGMASGFGMSFTAPPGTYVFEYSSDFLTWTGFQTNQVVSGPLVVSDPTRTSSGQRFYRSRRVGE